MHNVHVCRELAQGLVEVVHLCENATNHQNYEDICGGVRELVVARKCHLEGDTEGLDEHDGDGASGRANREVNERVLATVLGRNLVNHEDAEDDAESAVKEES